MQFNVAGSELDVVDDTRGASMAAGRQGVCGEHMGSCYLTIWIYTVMSSNVPTTKQAPS